MADKAKVLQTFIEDSVVFTEAIIIMGHSNMKLKSEVRGKDIKNNEINEGIGSRLKDVSEVKKYKSQDLEQPDDY